jgi:serine protease Do
VRRPIVVAVVGTLAITTTGCLNLGKHVHAAASLTPSVAAAASISTASSPVETSTASLPPSIPSSSPPPPTFQSLFADDSSGVVRIDAAACVNGEIGTGFLIAPNLVATVDHVVEDADSIRVTDPSLGITTSGVVLGAAFDQDVALVETNVPIAGHVFDLDDEEPAIGTDMAAIGFSLGHSLQIAIGNVQAIHDHRVVGDGNAARNMSDQALTSAAVNPGNSGGPWLDISGLVLALDDSGPFFLQGVASEGNNGGVPAVDAAKLFSAWEQANSPRPLADDGCAPTTAMASATATLNEYFFDIDNSDYASAFAQEAVAAGDVSGLEAFTNGVESSNDGPYDVTASGTLDGLTYLDVVFQSTQDAEHGRNGETCTDWSLRYTFVPVNGVELIKSSTASPGTSGAIPCPPAISSNAPATSAPASPLASAISSPPPSN